jgi:hypothetical protein
MQNDELLLCILNPEKFYCVGVLYIYFFFYKTRVILHFRICVSYLFSEYPLILYIPSSAVPKIQFYFFCTCRFLLLGLYLLCPPFVIVVL